MLATLAALTAVTKPAEQVFVFPYFTGNGETGMKLAVSGDGYKFRKVNGGKPVLQSTLGDGLIRDPSIVNGPDGTFHAVWTVGWWDKQNIGLAHSKDLLNWSEPQAVPVMANHPGTINCWAPEIHWSEEDSSFLIVWSSTVRGKFDETLSHGDPANDGQPLNHRMYATTTKDFKSWSPTKLFYNDNFNVIDGFIAPQKHQNKHVMVVKDETRFPDPKKTLRLATSDKIQGPYSSASDPISPQGIWCEGPTLLHDGKTWRLYFDQYMENNWGHLESPDLKTWTNTSNKLKLPEGARHGSIFLTDRKDLAALLDR